MDLRLKELKEPPKRRIGASKYAQVLREFANSKMQYAILEGAKPGSIGYLRRLVKRLGLDIYVGRSGDKVILMKQR